MIRKLLLIRKKDVHSKLAEELGLQGDILEVQPLAWAPEAGLSHYGFVVEMKLKDFQQFEKLIEQRLTYTLLPLQTYNSKKKEDIPIEKALEAVGLKVISEDE